MRATMTREEAVAFLETVAEIGQVEVERERSRRDRYRETMLSATAAEYVSIIKTVRCRRQEFLRLKKRLPDSDTDYEKKARFCLYGELASALGISMAEAETMILERLS
jgi:RNA polymerase-interacting CarD/CdnL/TRCF family regulator